MNALARLPRWATTGVGSLPHDAAEEAVAHVAAAYEVPFCPQLPRLEGDMIAEWLGADPRRCGWSPERDRQRPRAWAALLAHLDRSPPAHRVVKLQVTGPVTLACALEREGGPAATRALATELAVWLAANTREQIAALTERGLDTLLVVDEPALHLLDALAIERAWDPLRAIAPVWGLHLCGPVPWATVDRAEPDLLSLDLALARPDAAVVQRIVGRGGRIAWGVIQPHRLEHGLHGLARVRAEQADGAHSLLTPSCGSGRMALRREHELATAILDCARSLRAQDGTLTRTARV